MRKSIKFLLCILLCIFVMSSNTFVSYAAGAGGDSGVFGKENGTYDIFE